jgi:hypothetical protein
MGGVPEIITDILAKNLAGLTSIGKLLSIGLQFFCFRFIKTSTGSKISRKTSEFFPLGYFVIGEKVN